MHQLGKIRVDKDFFVSELKTKKLKFSQEFMSMVTSSTFLIKHDIDQGYEQ